MACNGRARLPASASTSPLGLLTIMDQLGSILFWDEYDVHLWLTGLGLPQYEMRIRGDILAQLNAESLKEIGIATVDQRLRILKAVYQVKLSQGVEIEPGHCIPPSELGLPQERSRHGDQDAAQTQRVAMNGYPSSENYRGRDTGTGRSIDPNPATGMTPTTSNGVITRKNDIFVQNYSRTTSNKKGKAHADDPVWKVLPVALKKHNITQNWRNYVMFMSDSLFQERRLAYDDKPHHIFKKLQEENKNPFFFVLKHVSDIHGKTGNSIHPYKTGKGALFNAVPGDAFIVISRNREQWFVQRDPSGTGIANNTLRVPPGRLLETDIPIASLPASNSPILSRNIISTAFPSSALMNYRKSNENGLSSGEIVHVFKRYKHLS